MILFILIFIISILFLFWSSRWLVESLTKIAKFLGWREFVFAFWIMAVAGSLPNIFVGIGSIIEGVPVLSLGEIFGGNIVDLTIAVALTVLISKNGLSVQSRTVRGTAFFTLIVAILPLLLIHDRVLSRIDGMVLLLIFIIYVFWLFSKQERFTRVYDGEEKKVEIKEITNNLFLLIGATVLLFLAAGGIIKTSIFFAETFNVPLILIGILVVGLGNALPEIFFGIQAARKDEDWMVVGGLMGAVIGAGSLALGLVALLQPIYLNYPEVSLLMVTRIFLILAAIFFLLFIRTNHKITRKEGIFLLIVYLSFIIVQILIV